MKLEKNFSFYEHLRFFYKKRFVFFTIVILSMLFAAVLSTFQGDKYKGSATFIFGKIDMNDFSDPDAVKSKYSKLITDNDALQVLSPKMGQIMLTVVGRDKSSVEKQFRRISQQYYKDLQSQYSEKIRLYKNYITTTNSRIHYLKKLNDSYRAQSSKDVYIQQTILANEKEIFSALSNSLDYGIEYQKLLQGQPRLLVPKRIDQLGITGHYIPAFSNLLVTFLLSVLISIILMTLWKYIVDARAYSHSREE